jgi:hypothetical protein
MVLELVDSNGIGYGAWAQAKTKKASTLVSTLVQLEI